MDWKGIALQTAMELDERVDRLRYRLSERYRNRPVRVVTYRGYGTPDHVRLRGRVLHGTPPGPASPEDRWWINLRNAYRRIESDEVPGARLNVRIHGAEASAVTDGEGYFDADVRLTDPIPANRYWHDAEVRLLQPEGYAATAQVAVPVHARFGVISDLDDTVLQTDVRNLLRMGRELLFGNVHTRVPFPGVGAFYRALHHDEERRNPLFYVSSSPWNLYDLLAEFLRLHRIPPGPMDLRDWGLARDQALPTTHHSHKRQAIDRILATFPDLPFILVGDSGQEDPEIYRQVVHDHPDRVLAVYIRSVVDEPRRIDELSALADELADHAGIDLVLADDTLDAARHAAERGWVPHHAVDDVARDRAFAETGAR